MEDRVNYQFKVVEFIGSQVQREASHSIYVEDGTQWVEVLREFTAFLSSIYGYSLDDQIYISFQNHETGNKDQVLLRDYY